VSVKKAKKSPRVIQYLLYVDQKLQKISLKRISERLKTRPPRPVRLKNSAGAPNSLRFPLQISSRAVIGVTCVVAAVALIAASQSGTRPDAARADASSEAIETKSTSMQMTPVRKPERAPAVQSAPKPAAVALAAQSAAVDSKVQPELQETAAVTITGCLERDGVTFWLKDASGLPDTPKARSWRSGFLKKRSSRVGVVSATNALRLPNYLGERVAATGALMDGQMRARSVRRLAASCK